MHTRQITCRGYRRKGGLFECGRRTRIIRRFVSRKSTFPCPSTPSGSTSIGGRLARRVKFLFVQLPIVPRIKSLCRGESANRSLLPQIIQKLRCGRDTGDEQMIPRTGARDVEQVPLRVVDLFQIGVVSNGLDARLQWNDLVVTGHHRDRPELQALGQMHAADRHLTVAGLDAFVQNFERHPGSGDRRACALQFRFRAHE